MDLHSQHHRVVLSHVFCARWRLLTLVGLSTAITSCGSDSLAPGTVTNGVTFVSVASVSDTVDAQLMQPFVVEVRAQNGKLLSGQLVRFSAQPAPPAPIGFFSHVGYVCQKAQIPCGTNEAFDTTDSRGRAEIYLRLGTLAYDIYVTAAAQNLPNASKVDFTVRPGAPTRVRAFAEEPSVDEGGTVAVRGITTDRRGNQRTESTRYFMGAGTSATVDSVTGLVRGLDMGTQRIYARVGAVADSSFLRVVPRGRLLGAFTDGGNVQLFNTNGTDVRTVVPFGARNFGYIRHADAGLNSISYRSMADPVNGRASAEIGVVDSLGAPVRSIRTTLGFNEIITSRLFADGTALVVARLEGATSPTPFAVWRITADGAVSKGVELPTPPFARWSADLSPTGNRLAFVSAGGQGSNELRVYDLATLNETVLAPDAREPVFSPQGTQVAFLAGSSPSQTVQSGSLFVVNVDGSGRRLLSNDAYLGGVGWAPDGTKIVARTAPQAALRIIRLADGAAVTLRLKDAGGFDVPYFNFDWWR